MKSWTSYIVRNLIPSLDCNLCQCYNTYVKLVFYVTDNITVNIYNPLLLTSILKFNYVLRKVDVLWGVSILRITNPLLFLRIFFDDLGEIKIWMEFFFLFGTFLTSGRKIIFTHKLYNCVLCTEVEELKEHPIICNIFKNFYS